MVEFFSIIRTYPWVKNIIFFNPKMVASLSKKIEMSDRNEPVNQYSGAASSPWNCH